MGDTPDTEEDRDIAQTVTRDHMRRVLAKLIRRDDVDLTIDDAEIGALLEETAAVVEESGVPA